MVECVLIYLVTVLIMQDAHFSVEDILYGRRMALQPLSPEEQQLLLTAQRHRLALGSDHESDFNSSALIGSADQVCSMVE